MPVVPSFIIEPVWNQFVALLPQHQVIHPLGCHRRRTTDRIIFDKLVQVLVFGCSYDKIADSSCSARALRRRWDEWIIAGVFTTLEHLVRDAYARLSGWA
jgi:transposase